MRRKKWFGLVLLSLLSISAAFVSYGSPNFQSAGYLSTANGGKNPMPEDYNSNCMFYTWGRTYEKTGQELSASLKGWYGWQRSEQLPQQPRENSIALWGYFGNMSHSVYVESFENGIVSYSEGNYLRAYHEGSMQTEAFKNNRKDGNLNLMKFYGFVYLQGWAKDATENHWKYWKADGSQAVSWNLIDNKLYYMDGNGVMQTGWLNLNGKNYYFYESGEMAKGWLELEDGNYYLDSDGVMYANQWVPEDGIRHYMGENGKMLRNTCVWIDGVEFDFDNSGAAVEKKKLPKPESKPEPKPEPKLESKPAQEPETAESSNKVTEYSYRTRTEKEETKTSEDPELSGWECIGTQEGTGSWGSWSDWSENYQESSDNVQAETRTVSSGENTQIYLGRYYSVSKNNFSPDKLDSTYNFEGGWFDESNVTFIGQAYTGGRTDCYTIPGYHYYFFEIGSHGGEQRSVSTGTKNEYRYRQKAAKTVYKYRRTIYTSWSEWSAWSETPMEENECTEVRARSRSVS